ncbi:MAG: DUF3618 domain-containing protein [Deltaproteobacteria bacterium]|nr:DUF3618 domain-containing protein [Deltaproteobacteria bacterium]
MNATTNLTEDARKDPATLEREIDQTRIQMNQTLGALERKFSPGQLLDQVWSLVREHGGDFTSNLNNSVKQNPMPVILAATGIAWMMVASNRPQSTSYVDAVDNDYEPVGGFVTPEFDPTGNDKGKLAEAGARMKAGAEATRQKLASSKEAVASTVSKTAGNAQAQAKRMGKGFNSLLEDQPLILGALGIALGAAIGAALPATEQEDRLLGPLRDRTMSTVKERGAESYNQVQESVSRVGEDAKQAITRATGAYEDRQEPASNRIDEADETPSMTRSNASSRPVMPDE